MRSAFKKLRMKFLLINLCLTLFLIGGIQLAIYNVVDLNIANINRQRLNEMGQMEMQMRIEHEESDRRLEWSVEVEGEGGRFSFDSSGRIEDGLLITSDIVLIYDRVFTIRMEANEVIITSTLGYSDLFYDLAFEMASESEGSFELAGRYWMYQRLYNRDSLVQITFLDTTDSRELLNTLLHTFLMVSPLSLGVAFIISYFFASRSIKPVAAMWESQRRFVTDASHELKTPLSIIMANHDVMAGNLDETVESQKQWLSHIKVGTDRMAKLVNQMLLLAKTEDFSGATTITTFSLTEVIQDLTHDFETMAHKQKITLMQSSYEKLTVTTQKETLCQIIETLLENAVKHTPEGGSIQIEAKREGSYVQVVIENSIGIKKDHLPYLFDRFYRVDESRNSETGGFGLGLSIAKRATDQLKGDLKVESNGESWTRFTVKFKG